MDKTEYDYRVALVNLGHHLDSIYNHGKNTLYLEVAVILRKLLCDKENSLLSRARPKIWLHKLTSTKEFERTSDTGESLVFMYPLEGKNFGNGRYSAHLALCDPPEWLQVSDWIEQKFVSGSITIRKFIKCVADKEGAHSDKDYGEDLSLVKSVLIGEGQHESTIAFTTAIGWYVYTLLNYEFVDDSSPQLTPTEHLLGTNVKFLFSGLPGIVIARSAEIRGKTFYDIKFADGTISNHSSDEFTVANDPLPDVIDKWKREMLKQGFKKMTIGIDAHGYTQPFFFNNNVDTVRKAYPHIKLKLQWSSM